MASGVTVLRSSIVKKFVMALTGLGLVGFIITHLAANLLLYKKDGTAFNQYAHSLEGFGVLLYVAEIGLLALFVLHILTAIRLKIGYKMARPTGYVSQRSKGAPSRSNLASRNMVISGLILMVFLVLHVFHFKFGPGIAEGYVINSDAGQVRDLHRWVVENFKNPVYVALYVGAMLFLGMHLRHGFWSAFQSLGAMSPKVSCAMYCAALAVAVLLAGGFLFIPIWIYFGMGA